MVGSSRGARRVAVVGVALAVIAVGVNASAQRASEEYERAGAMREAQRFEEALRLYEALHQRTQEPRALAQRGVTEAQMGRWVAAEEHLTAALATGDRWVRHHRDALRAALEQTRRHVGDLTVTGNVAGARLSVNGTSVGTLPRAAVRVAVGPAVIDVDADGYEPLRQTVDVQGASTRVEVSLVRRPAAPAVEAAATPAVSAEPSAPRPPSTPARVDIVVRTERPDEGVSPLRVDVLPPARTERGMSTGRVLAWVSAGAGVLFLGAGVAGLVVGADAAARWNDPDACQPGNASREEACASDRSTAESMRVVAVVGFAGGAAAAVASTVLFLTSGERRATARERAGVRCGLGPGDVGIQCGGVF